MGRLTSRTPRFSSARRTLAPLLKSRPQSFNPDQLAARRQREMEQVQSLAHGNTNPIASVSVSINTTEEKWICPACTFSNPVSAKQCVVCNTKRGAVIEKKANEDIFGDDEEEVSIKTRKTRREAKKRETVKRDRTPRVSSSAEGGKKSPSLEEGAKSDGLAEIPSDLELIPL